MLNHHFRNISMTISWIRSCPSKVIHATSPDPPASKHLGHELSLGHLQGFATTSTLRRVLAVAQAVGIWGISGGETGGTIWTMVGETIVGEHVFVCQKKWMSHHLRVSMNYIIHAKSILQHVSFCSVVIFLALIRPFCETDITTTQDSILLKFQSDFHPKLLFTDMGIS